MATTQPPWPGCVIEASSEHPDERDRESGCSRMTIDRIEPIALRLPFRGRNGVPTEHSAAIHLVICRVTTKSGVVGYGESLCYIPAMQDVLATAIRDVIAPAYVGQRVGDMEALNLAIRQRYAAFGRAGTIVNALGAVDIALWDIAGKEAGRPLSDLLGGARRTSVPVMASLDRHDDIREVRPRIERALKRTIELRKVPSKKEITRARME